MCNLVTEYGEDIGSYVYTEYSLTETGKSFLLRLMRYPGSQKATEYYFPKDMDSERGRRAGLLKQRATNDENSDVRQNAVRELARSWKDYADTLAILKQRACSDEGWVVRQTALQELVRGWKDDPDTLKILKERASSDKDGDVRQGAVQELLRGWNEDSDVTEWLARIGSIRGKA
jgi:HEAT repeats